MLFCATVAAEFGRTGLSGLSSGSRGRLTPREVAVSLTFRGLSSIGAVDG